MRNGTPKTNHHHHRYPPAARSTTGILPFKNFFRSFALSLSLYSRSPLRFIYYSFSRYLFSFSVFSLQSNGYLVRGTRAYRRIGKKGRWRYRAHVCVRRENKSSHRSGNVIVMMSCSNSNSNGRSYSNDSTSGRTSNNSNSTLEIVLYGTRFGRIKFLRDVKTIQERRGVLYVRV